MYLKKKNYYFLGLGDGAARHWAQYCDARYIAVPRLDPSKQNKTYQLVRKMLMIILTKFKTSQNSNLKAHQL